MRNSQNGSSRARGARSVSRVPATASGRSGIAHASASAHRDRRELAGARQLEADVDGVAQERRVEVHDLPRPLEDLPGLLDLRVDLRELAALRSRARRPPSASSAPAASAASSFCAVLASMPLPMTSLKRSRSTALMRPELALDDVDLRRRAS